MPETTINGESVTDELTDRYRFSEEVRETLRTAGFFNNDHARTLLDHNPDPASIVWSFAQVIHIYRGYMNRANERAEKFRNEVREKALEVSQRMGWCKQGMNDVLEELGLEPYVTRYSVQITVTVETDDGSPDHEEIMDALSDGDYEMNAERIED